jgi:hypothetical protein
MGVLTLDGSREHRRNKSLETSGRIRHDAAIGSLNGLKLRGTATRSPIPRTKDFLPRTA